MIRKRNENTARSNESNPHRNAAEKTGRRLVPAIFARSSKPALATADPNRPGHERSCDDGSGNKGHTQAYTGARRCGNSNLNWQQQCPLVSWHEIAHSRLRVSGVQHTGSDGFHDVTKILANLVSDRLANTR